MSKLLHQTVATHFGKRHPEVKDSFGVEVELEGLPEEGVAFGRTQGWRQVADGSLRQGTEFTSAGPRSIKQLEADVDELRALFEQHRFTPVFSYRTSVHVHANATDLTLVQVGNLWSLYTIFEAPLIDFGGEERRGNVHCMPVSDCTASLNSLRRFFCDDKNVSDTHRIQALGRMTSNDRRYGSFNWAALAKFGTIEFRSHRGTLEKATIMGWVRTINLLKQAAKKFNNPQEIVEQFSTRGIQGFTEEVFGSNHPLTNMVSGYTDDMWAGVRLCQEIAYSRTDWSKPGSKRKQREVESDETAPFNQPAAVPGPNWATINEIVNRDRGVREGVQWNLINQQWAQPEQARDEARARQREQTREAERQRFNTLLRAEQERRARRRDQ